MYCSPQFSVGMICFPSLVFEDRLLTLLTFSDDVVKISVLSAPFALAISTLKIFVVWLRVGRLVCFCLQFLHCRLVSVLTCLLCRRFCYHLKVTSCRFGVVGLFKYTVLLYSSLTDGCQLSQQISYWHFRLSIAEQARLARCWHVSFCFVMLLWVHCFIISGRSGLFWSRTGDGVAGRRFE